MGAIASVNNRYDYSESTEILPEVVESALKVLGQTQDFQQNDRRQNRISTRVKVNHLDVPFYHKHPFYDFRFDKKIGEGAYSSVYKVTQVSQTGQLVMKNFSSDPQTPDWRPLRFAIKEVILADLTDQQLKNVQREIQFLSQLNHPDVVCMHAVYSTVPPDLKVGRPSCDEAVVGGIDLIRNKDKYTQLYIVLEYLQGGELLKAVCARSRYDEDDARDLLLQIFEGIRYIHSRGIIHRDIKPENLILSSRNPDNKIKIVDFGFAMLSDESEGSAESRRASEDRAALKSTSSAAGHEKKNTEFLCGTPGYIAPEVLRSRLYTTKCDMWAAGVVMYILLSGTMPFAVDDSKAQMRGQYSLASSRWITVTDAAKDLVTSLLKVNHIARLSAEQALEHPWMKKGTRMPNTPSKAVFGPSQAGAVEQIAAFTHEPVGNLAAVPSADTSGEVSPGGSKISLLSGPVPKSVSSVDTPNGKVGVGDLTHNLPALRQVGLAKRLKRGMHAVRSAVRFKSLGLTRERRRSSSNASQEDMAGSPAQQSTMNLIDGEAEVIPRSKLDREDAGSEAEGENKRMKPRAMSEVSDGGVESNPYEDFDDSIIN